MDEPGAPSRRLLPELLAVAALIAAVPPQPPALSTLLASPPSADFVEDTEPEGIPIGQFDAGAYVEYLQPEDQSTTVQALKKDGFVVGFGKSWTAQSDGRVLAELVVAFNGGRGARNWLATSEAMARANQYYAGDIAVDGIGRYVGVHYAEPKAPAYADVVMFVKGNDFFLVGFESRAADLGDAVAAQSRLQYEFAAPASIPPAQWPENANASSRPPIALFMIAMAGLSVIVAAVAVAVVLWLNRREGAGAMAEAPAGAIRSDDGKLWWDGKEWRPAPPAD
jgi:hypothetical protein